MSQLEEVQLAQKSLEEMFLNKMDQLQAQLQTTSTAKETVAKVAEEFRSFRELVYSMLSLLRKQINECASNIDSIQTWQRRKALIFQGISETENENCSGVVLEIIQSKIGMKNLKADCIKASHRLGNSKNERPRPILVRFTCTDTRSAVWRAKTKLRGTSISVKEFLTRSRQLVFSKARLHFGIRDCWTNDGVVVIKTSDGGRHRVTCMAGLQPLLQKFSKTATDATKTSTLSRNN